MEIDIPDLDDVEFVKKCFPCQGTGTISPYKKGPATCYRCDGIGKDLTQVGKRLIEFLESLGLTIDKDGWRDIE